MRNVNEIIVHCAYSKPSMDVGTDWLRKIHVEQNGWSDIGYHYIIRRNGTLESGRPIDKMGAHCKGHNRNTFGICLIGGMSEKGNPENNFTEAQFQQLKQIVNFLKITFPTITKISGHREYSKKACPCFEVNEILML